MFNVIFLYTFSLAMIIANVYCFIKKKYLYLFFPCVLFLPTFYGIEIAHYLPLLTVSRMMYLVFFLYALLNRRRSFSLKSFNIKSMSKENYLLIGYFALRLISNLYYITTYSQAAKTILFIIFEQLLLLIAIYILAPTKREINIIIKAIVWVAAVLFVVGIVESYIDFRPFDALYTVQRDVYNLFYYRLGLLRATTTMYAPAIYGNMCILVLPLILYLYETTNSKKYLVIIGLNVLAIIHSGSRSDMLYLFAVAFVYFIFVLSGKSRRILSIKNGAVIAVVLVLFMSIASFVSPNLKYFYTGTAKSILNEVGFDFDLDEGAPKDSKGFGGNPYGSISRTRQFTGIYYVAKINPIFGLGSAAQVRHQVQYYWHCMDGTDKWMAASAYDVGLVEIFCDEGLLGTLGLISLIAYMVRISRKNKYSLLCIFCFLLSTLSTGNMYSFLMLYLIIIMNQGFERVEEDDKAKSL